MEITHKNQGELDSTMLPFRMRAGRTGHEEKALPCMMHCIIYILPSCITLLDKSTKLWYSSTLSFYETLEKRKTEENDGITVTRNDPAFQDVLH